MAAITEDAVRTLAATSGGGAPIISCYLDVDGRRYPRRQDYEYQLEALLRRARDRVNGNGHAPNGAARDLERIQDYVQRGIDRSKTRGLAMFSCTAADLWQVIPLPVPVRNQVVVNPAPAVGQLELVLHTYEPIGVLLADRQEARLFVFDLGELVERTDVFDELPRDYDQRGERDQGEVRGHVDDLVSRHVRRAARAALDLLQEREFRHLVVAAPDDLLPALKAALHPDLQERLADRLPVSVNAGIGDVRAAVLEVEARIEATREAALVDRLRAGVATRQRACAGLDEVLEALVARRVEYLLVSLGYAEAGWRCDACGLLATVGRRCPLCDDRMTEVPDVVEEAVEEAITQSCRVEVCAGNADLDVLGRIGALLRY